MAQAGWFPDPDGTPDRMRFWDGTSWSDATAPIAPPSPASAPQPTPASSTPNPPRAPQPRRRLGVWVGAGAGVLALGLIVALLSGAFAPPGGLATASPAPTVTPNPPRPTPTPTRTQEPVVTCAEAVPGKPLKVAFATLTVPPTWFRATTPRVPGASCASRAEGPVSEGWVSEAIVAQLKASSQTLENDAEGLFKWFYLRGYEPETKPQLKVTRSAAAPVSGLPAWHVDAEVRVTGIPGVTGDRVQLVVVEHPSQGRLLLITCHALNHTPTQTAAAAVWSSFRVTK